MASKDWPRGRGEAAQLSNLKIATQFIDPYYELQEEDLTRGDTRYLKVFSLIPKTQGRPSFHARVDDGTPEKWKDPELDIDIRGVSEVVEGDFNAKRNGYSGHRTKRSPTRNERIFDVEITAQYVRVFQGQVFFNVTFSESLTAKADFGSHSKRERHTGKLD